MAKVKFVLSRAGYLRGNSSVGDVFEVEEAEAKRLEHAGIGTISKEDAARLQELEGQALTIAELQQQLADGKVTQRLLEGQLSERDKLISELTGEVERLRARLAEAEPEPAEPSATPLPDDFPRRDKLLEAGYTTVEQVAELSDDDLMAVDGIGKASLAEIRARL